MKDGKFYLIGCASGIAGADIHSGDGPLTIRQSRYLSEANQSGVPYEWKEMIATPGLPVTGGKRIDELVADACRDLAKVVTPLARDGQAFCIVGGDHSCAIGTWSAVYEALHHKGDLGLIWFDAHMDSHTPETSESQRIHGMPLACLLGYGYSTLTSLMSPLPKFKPENVCLVGVRSFESGEAALLRRLNVRIYFMDEIHARGFDVVMQEAIEHVNRNTIGYGLSLDLDGLDPRDAPGVDVPEADGVRADEFCVSLTKMATDPRLIATEVVEFDPTHDENNKTEILLAKILNIIAVGAVGSVRAAGVVGA
jgi:arginase